jgi:hypothetical protein
MRFAKKLWRRSRNRPTRTMNALPRTFPVRRAKVIERLLDDGKFGYIILSPLQDPNGIQKVILTVQMRDSPKALASAQMAGQRASSTPPAEPSPNPTAAAEVRPSSPPPLPFAQSPAAGGETPSGDQAKPIPVDGTRKRCSLRKIRIRVHRPRLRCKSCIE